MGPKAYLTSLTKVGNSGYLIIALLILSSQCFGDSIWNIFSISVFFWWLTLSTFVLHKYGQLLISFFCLVAIWTLPASCQLASFFVVILFSQTKYNEGYAFLGSQVLYLLAVFSPVPLIVLEPWVSGLIFLVSFLLLENKCRGLTVFFKSCAILYAVLLIAAQFMSWSLPPISNNVAPGYSIGPAIENVIGEKQIGDAYLVYDSNREFIIPPTGNIYFDHDSLSNFTDGNYSQRRPWGQNVLVGPEHFRFAIAQDGVLVLNKGSRIKDNVGRCLIGVVDGFRTVPFLVIEKNRIITADSDFLVDRLAPYQEHLIQTLTGKNWLIRGFHIGTAILLLGSILSRIMAQVSFFVYPVLLFTVSIIPQQGDVRYVGRNIKWPHSNLGYGLVRALQDQGHNVRFGDINTELLVVAGGSSSRWRGEKIIILEPNASVWVGNECYAADTIPQGCLENILDARKILCNGKELKTAKITMKQVTIIATGTPAALKFSTLPKITK